MAKETKTVESAYDILTSLDLMGKPCTPTTGKELFDIDAVVQSIFKAACIVSEKMLYAYQQEFFERIVRAILEHKGEVITGLWSRQSGKTECIADIVGSCMIFLPELAKQFPDDWRLNITDDFGRYRGYKAGVNFGIYAPILDQSQIMHERIRSMFETEGATQIMSELGITFTTNRGNIVKLSNGSSVLAMSASGQSKIEGHTHHIVIVEEAQDVEAQKVRKCFARGTKLLSRGGVWYPIEHVVQGELPVYTPDGMKYALEYHVNGKQEVYEVFTDEGRSLQVTANHQHPVRWKGMKKPYVKKMTWELEVGWQVAVPDSTAVFGEAGTHEQGFVLGVLLGDGCVSGSKPQAIMDHETREAVRRCCKLEWPDIEVKTYGEASGMFDCGLTKEDSANSPNPLTQWLRELGVWGCKGKGKHVPSREWSDDFLRGLVEGLIVTNGCVEASDTKPVISFANISERLVDSLQDILLQFGIHAAKYEFFQIPKKGKGCLKGLKNYEGNWLYRLHIKGIEDIRRFYDTFKLCNKQENLEHAVKCLEGKEGRESSQFYPSKYRFARITAIRRVGERETYCVTVPTEEHLLVANGIVSSNSIHPMVASTKGLIVKIGTASIHKGDFFHAIKQNKRKEIVKGIRNHFFFPYQICCKHNSLYRDYIEEEKMRINEGSDEFKMSYECQWLLERGMFITDRFLMAEGVALTEGKYSKLYDRYSAPSLVVAFDLGKETDSTVITVAEVDWTTPVISQTILRNYKETEFMAYMKHIIAWKEYQGDDYEFQYHEAVQWLSGFKGIKKVILDATREAAFADRIRHTPLFVDAEVQDFVFSLQTKAQGYRLFNGDLLAKRITFPAGEEARKTLEYRKFVTQMLDLMKVYHGEYLVVGHPEEQGAHDDYPVSAMLVNYSSNEPTADLGMEILSSNLLMR